MIYCICRQNLKVLTGIFKPSVSFCRLTAYSEFLLEGDLSMPETRNSLRCLSEAYSCFWPKSANGYVEIPFNISSKYGGHLHFHWGAKFVFCFLLFLFWQIHTLSAIVFTGTLWSATADNKERQLILTAMADIEYGTCVRFVQRSNQRGYLSIEPKFGWVNSDNAYKWCERGKSTNTYRELQLKAVNRLHFDAKRQIRVKD